METRAVLRWLVLFAFVWLARYAADSAASAVLGWLGEVALDLERGAGAETTGLLVGLAVHGGVVAAQSAASGFAAAMIFGLSWPRAAALSWAVFALLLYAPFLPASLRSPWFHAEVLLALAASMAGAWLHERNRRHPRVEAVREAVLSSRLLNL